MSTPDSPNPVDVAAKTRRRRRRRRSTAVKRPKASIAIWVVVALLATTAVFLLANRRTLADDWTKPENEIEKKGTPVRGYEVVHEYPHDPDAFTQGLVYRDNYFYESTGLEGESTLRKVEIESGKVLHRYDVPRPYFAEGLTDWGVGLVQLTYTSQVGFIYDVETLTQRSTFQYQGQGWGLTHDDARLIMSDGSSSLRFLDPNTQKETGRVQVQDEGKPVTNLNELEYVKGAVYANVWHTDRIAVIELPSGRVREWIDLAGLNPIASGRSEAVLNGIAYDPSRERLFVTGKWWQSVYEIRVRHDDPE